MGSLPELAERVRPQRAARTASDPNRNSSDPQWNSSDPHRSRTQPQIPVSTICKKEWLWKKPPSVPRPPLKRKDSGCSSVGATSVRRLINRQPPGIPPLVVKRFSVLCVCSGVCAAAMLPFTAFAGAEGGAMPLAAMHLTAAVIAPFSPFVLRKVGSRIVVSLSHLLVCILLAAHTVPTPLWALWSLYCACGVTLSPASLALTAAATATAHHHQDDHTRKVALRRALRGLRAAQDLGLVVGALMLGGALLLWPEPGYYPTSSVANSTDDYFLEDDYEEQWCGAAGCPATSITTGSTLSSTGRHALVLSWACLALLSSVGTALSPVGVDPLPDVRPRDARALLSAPTGLFIGLQQGFIYTSYVRWYGVCVGGWGCAATALFGAGILQSLAAATLSMAAARGRRGALVAGGAAAHASLMLALLRWRASASDMVLPAVAASAWGACAALWDVLQSSILVGGCSWRGPWSCTLGARHVGLAAACAARHVLCAREQLAALATALAFALAAHAVLEIRHRKGAESGCRRQS